MKVRKNLVAKSKHSIKCPYAMKAEYITFHNTYNDASAENEIAYMIKNNNQVSYHYAVDDKEVVQGIPTNRNAWHCGDGGSGTGNRKSIGVEVCYSKSGGAKYKKAEKNAIKFIAQLLHERKWGINKVKKHQDWSGKYCPHRVLDEGRWNQVVKDIEKELNKLSGKSTSSTSNSSSSSSSKSSNKSKGKANYNTKSIVTFLQSINQPFSFNHRKKLAGYYKVGTKSGYKGTQAQNTELLTRIKKDYKAKGKLRTSKPKSSNTSSSSSKSIAQMAKEVKAGKHGNGHANRRKSLGVSQATYNKVRAEVNKGTTTSKSSGKSVNQIATEIIKGKGIPNGHAARRKHFGITQAKYEQVRAEVNRRLS